MDQDQNPNTAPSNTPAANQGPVLSPGPAAAKARLGSTFYIILSVLLLGLTVGGIYWLFRGSSSPKAALAPAVSKNNPLQPAQPAVQGVQLIAAKDYGNKYAKGILPVGDGLYTTDSAKQGYIYACSGYASNMKTAQGGAGRRGPWFIGTTKYDLNKKAHVRGSVMWQAQFTNKVSGNTRTITTNNLPDHPSGIFPISPSDPAYAYDRNPSSIKGQAFTYSLSSAPAYGSPSCMGGQVGVMLTGVALFSGFDAAGRDAGAWEVQDSCDGHPEKEGVYHYHTLSGCIKNISVKTVIGFALDGFPITGPQVGASNILTTADLDECHGLTSQVVLDGKNVTTYHYVMTQDFPYSVSCYRGTAIQPPGQQAPAKN